MKGAIKNCNLAVAPGTINPFMQTAPTFDASHFRKLARSISIVENEANGFEDILLNLKNSSGKIIGITGAPGAGKSSLTDALISEMVNDGKKVGVLCVDPSSPFNKGALLGDRIRMSDWYNHPSVFIRSLASRGALGGLHPKIIEITDVMKAAGFDFIIIETVGVGQSEVDIAGLADVTLVLLVPEGGDAIQSMKSGVMEIADIFVVNKFDRPGAETFYQQLKKMLTPDLNSRKTKTPVLKTIASQKTGIEELYQKIKDSSTEIALNYKYELLSQKMMTLIAAKLISKIDVDELKNKLKASMEKEDFNLYRLISENMSD